MSWRAGFPIRWDAETGARGEHPAPMVVYPDCRYASGDINGDGSPGFRDINPFVALLSGGGCN